MTTFTFTYFRNRFGGSTNTVRLTKTSAGWDLDAKAYTGQIKPNGTPLLYGSFDQDGVAYPPKMTGFLEYIWQQFDNNEWTGEQTQKCIQDVADWVSACEQAVPKLPGWN